MSARRWKDRFVFWRALVFWAWVASFSFGFAATDLLHAPNHPEQLALQGAAHSSSSHLAPPQAITLDVHCLSFLLQLDADGILAIIASLVVPFAIAAVLARLLPTHAIARALITSARGPPVSFI